METSQSKKLCLIDASGYIHRAYHALPPLTTTKGEPVNAIYGFSRMIAKLLKQEKPDYLGVCFDTPSPTFRHEVYAEYKGTRAETDASLIAQLPVAEELARVWGLPCLKKDGFEADDLIATLAVRGRERGWDVLVLSGDKDILQLVDEKISVRDEIRKVEFTSEKVHERFGVTPDQLVDYFSLMGDKVDNVVGVPGVGEKTASKLIAEHGSLENLYANLNGTKESLKEKLLAHKEAVFKNRYLIKLHTDVPVNSDVENLKIGKPDPEALSNLLQRLEFRQDLFGSQNGEEAPPPSHPILERKVNIVLTKNDLISMQNHLSHTKRFSYDLETDSADQHHCQIVGVAVSGAAGEGFYIPVGHRYIGAPAQLLWSEVRSFLQPFFDNSGILKCGQNLKFDDTILSRFGLQIHGPQFDTMVAAYCVDPSRPSYGLKEFSTVFFGERMVTFGEVVGKEKGKTMADVPIETAAPYAAADAEVVWRLVDLFQTQLKEGQFDDLFQNLEMPLVRVIQAMEEAGIRMDVSYLRKVGEKFDGKKKILEEEIYEMAGARFSLNSPQQLSRILFEKLNLPAIKKTKTGFSTNEDVLRKLAPQHPICEKIISYRELAKLSSTYVDSLLELVDPATERVHTSFHQTGTTTGRLSSSDPNLQNIPIRSEQGREIRRAFVAGPKNILLSADYSQIDLRSLAHMSEDPVLIETFKAGGDVHTATASQIFHVPPNEVTPDMRRNAKAINFGIVYGQQAWGLSQGLGIPVEEATTFIEAYFKRYAGVKSWIERTLLDARRTGVVTTLAGRRRRVDDINSENNSIRGFSERIAVNTPIQGTSADIIKAAMIRVYRELMEGSFKTLMLVQVHDELLFEVPEEEMDHVLPLIRKGMEGAYSLRVPLVVDIKTGPNWNDMISFGKAA